MVGTNVSVEPTIVVRFKDFKYPRIAVAISMACFTKITVFKVFYIADMRKRNSVTMLSYDFRYVVVGVGIQATRTERQAVVFVVHHFQETVNARLVHQKSGQAENIPRRIVHVDCHLDIAFSTSGHNRFQEIFEVLPKLFFRYGRIRFEQFVQLRHTNHSKDNSFYDSSTPVSDIGGGIGYAGRFVHTINLLQDLPYQGNVQPCLTDENVYQLVLSNVRKWLDANPEATIISVSQNDSDPGKLGCQCENCKAIDDAEGSPMGSLLTFINRIANDIKDDYPGVYVDTLAYRYTRKPPKTVRPADNVIIRLCSIECCFTHPLSDETCYKNKAFKKDIEAWAAICDNLYIWDYTYNAETYFTFFPNFDVLWDNVNFYKDHNVKGVFLEGQQVSVSGEFGELRSYLLAKLLWLCLARTFAPRA